MKSISSDLEEPFVSFSPFNDSSDRLPEPEPEPDFEPEPDLDPDPELEPDRDPLSDFESESDPELDPEPVDDESEPDNGSEDIGSDDVGASAFSIVLNIAEAKLPSKSWADSSRMDPSNPIRAVPEGGIYPKFPFVKVDLREVSESTLSFLSLDSLLATLSLLGIPGGAQLELVDMLDDESEFDGSFVSFTRA
jgi:hypothetical protein